MFDRLRQHVNERAVRYTMILIIVAFIGFGVTWLHTASVDAYLAYVTPILAFASALLVLAFALNPTDNLYRLAGWITTTTLMARVGQVIMNMVYQTAYKNQWTGVSSIINITLCALLLGRTWDRDVRQWLTIKKESR